MSFADLYDPFNLKLETKRSPQRWVRFVVRQKMPRKPKSAADLMRQLEADPAWVARRDSREAQLSNLKKECAEDQSQMLDEMCSVGIDIESVWDLVNNQPNTILKRSFTGSYQAAYPILMRHLTIAHHTRVRAGIIRALTVKDGGPELEALLFDQFYSEQDHTHRWVLANALRTAVPYHRRRKHPKVTEILKIDTYTNKGEQGAAPNP